MLGQADRAVRNGPFFRVGAHRGIEAGRSLIVRRPIIGQDIFAGPQRLDRQPGAGS